MNVKYNTINELDECFTVPQWLVPHLLINVVPGDPLRPVLALLDKELAFHSNFVKGNYTLCNAKATVATHYLPVPCNGSVISRRRLTVLLCPICVGRPRYV